MPPGDYVAKKLGPLRASRDAKRKVKEAKANRDIAGLVDLYLHDKDARIWGAAWVALFKLRDPSAIPLLIDALSSRDAISTAETVRGRAVNALGGLGDGRAVEPLTAALNDEDPGVRRGAAEALNRIRAREGPEKESASRAIQALLVLSDTEVRGVQDLLQQIVDQQRGRGHSIDPGFRAVARVTSTPRDAAYAYAAVRSEFPDLNPDGLADRTERFDFKSADGTATGHYYIVFDRPAAG